MCGALLFWSFRILFYTHTMDRVVAVDVTRVSLGPLRIDDSVGYISWVDEVLAVS